MDQINDKRNNPEYVSPIYLMALEQFFIAAEKLGLDDNMVERMKSPERCLVVSLPIVMDDGKLRNFFGYRVQHLTALGPGKGGVRYHPDVTLGEVASLASLMTWKGGLMNIPLGGAKGGVSCNPKEMSQMELERLTRRYTSAIFPLIGPEIDVPAPDVGTTAQTMAWIMDTYSVHQGFHTAGVVTGKPLITGGSQGREEATGLGVAYTIREAAKKINLPLSGATVAVQGFGNVGHHAAHFLQEMGAVIIAISNSTGGVLNEKGLPIKELSNHSKEKSRIRRFLREKDLKQHLKGKNGGAEEVGEENANDARDKLMASLEEDLEKDNQLREAVSLLTGWDIMSSSFFSKSQ